VSAVAENLTRFATSDRKKVSTREDVPLVRVRKEVRLREGEKYDESLSHIHTSYYIPNSQRQEIDAIKHKNEVIRLDAIRGTREAKINVKSGAAQEVARLQDQAEMYFQRIQVEKVHIHETNVVGMRNSPFLHVFPFDINRGRLGSWKNR
jgi:hypothetical protein